MDVKLFGGIAAGAACGGGIAYFLYTKKIKCITEDINRKNNSKLNSIICKNENQQKYDTIIKENRNKLHDCILKAYADISNVDMLADISNIDEESRDECFAKLEQIGPEIKSLFEHAITSISSTEIVEEYIGKINNRVQQTFDDIKDIINTAEDIDDDESDDESLISPKRLILKGVGCDAMIFDADPDDGFEVLDGSDIENNEYCIVAQNIPRLYRILFDSVKNQLSEHYIQKICPDTFDEIIDDIVITITISFINETDAVITGVNAVIPFELIGITTNNKINVYSIENGEIEDDDIIRYFRSNNGSCNIPLQQKTPIENRVETKKIDKTKVELDLDAIDVSISDENIQFILDTVGFSRESLKSFSGKVDILCEINAEAGNAIKDAFANNIREIHILKETEGLTEQEKLRIANSFRALISNMKKNYGAIIKAYSQNV